MKKKQKLNSLEDLGGLVYSTNQNEDLSAPDNSEPQPKVQHLEAHLEKKGRGGKTAILVKGFVGSANELKQLGKDLKSHCATGGAVKDGMIIIQGDLREKITAYLVAQGHKVKRVGG